MATQLVLVQSLGVRVLPPEREAAFGAVATLTAAPTTLINGLGTSGWCRPRSSRGLGRQVLNLVTRVRIPYGVPRGPVRSRAGSGAFRIPGQTRWRRWPVSLNDRTERIPVDEAATRVIPQ